MPSRIFRLKPVLCFSLSFVDQRSATRPKGGPIKVAIAHELRQLTCMTRDWIVTALHMRQRELPFRSPESKSESA